jgi:tetratricopeptide (TPR) repeat protein
MSVGRDAGIVCAAILWGVAGLATAPHEQQPKSAEMAVKFDPCARESFYHDPMTDDQVYHDFKPSVLRLNVEGSDTGTGYVIDADRGFVLTAFHVVKDAYQTRTDIQGTNPSLEGAVLHLKIVAHLDDPQDTALLQIENTLPLAQHHVHSLDIALNLPSGTHYRTIGYPLGKVAPDAQTAELLDPYFSYQNGRYLEVKQNVDAGSSGSPLIDEDGAVVATLNYWSTITEALYTPIVDVQDLLDRIPADGKVDLLETEVSGSRSVGSAVRHLIEELKWSSDNPSNVELYEWAAAVSADDRAAKAIRPYLSCPVVLAYSERRLTEARGIQKISATASPGDRARVLMDALNQDLFRQRFEQARGDAQEAVAVYDRLGSSADPQILTLVGRADLYTDRYDAARDYFGKALVLTPSEPQQAELRLYTAQAYAKQGDLDHASTFIRDALRQLHSNGDLRDEAVAFDTLGQVELRKGEYKKARAEFTQADETYHRIADVRGSTQVDTELAEINELESQSWRTRAVEIVKKPRTLTALVIVLFLIGGILAVKRGLLSDLLKRK